MKEQLATQQREEGRPVKLVSAHVLVDRTNEIRDRIACRAYELFESRGYVHGLDVDYWLQAESELLHPCRHEMKESSEATILHADVPGPFSPEQLKISVEPRRLMVSGESELNVLIGDSMGTHTERKPRHIFRVHDLPIEVDPSRTTATLKDEMLEIVLPKAAAAMKPGDKARATSPGR